MNFGTAYIDGSSIYGATPESADKLRQFDGGFLKVTCLIYIAIYKNFRSSLIDKKMYQP